LPLGSFNPRPAAIAAKGLVAKTETDCIIIKFTPAKAKSTLEKTRSKSKAPPKAKTSPKPRISYKKATATSKKAAVSRDTLREELEYPASQMEIGGAIVQPSGPKLDC